MPRYFLGLRHDCGAIIWYCETMMRYLNRYLTLPILTAFTLMGVSVHAQTEPKPEAQTTEMPEPNSEKSTPQKPKSKAPQKDIDQFFDDMSETAEKNKNGTCRAKPIPVS